MTANYKGTIATLKGAGQDITSIEQMQFIQADSLVKTGEMAQGITQLETIEAAHPEVEDVHRGLGEAYEAQGEKAKGFAELNKAIELNGNDAEARYDMGKAEMGSGENADAIHQLEIAVRLLPDDSRFHRELARAYRLGSRIGDAQKEFAIYEKLSAPSAANQSAAPIPGK